MPEFNKEFMISAFWEEGNAFIAYIGRDLDEVLCEHYERVVGKDNCVSFDGLKLQIPKDTACYHYVKVTVRIHRYGDGKLAIFHGPRCLARYDGIGQEIRDQLKTAA